MAAKPAPDFAGGIQAKSLGSSALTKYPLSADGKYYNVNLLQRNFLPPTANATFANGAYQLGQAAPPFVFDGRDTAFTAVTSAPGDPNATVTLTVDMGQYYSVGAIRPLYQPLGGGYPFKQRIRLATKLGDPNSWTTVVDGPVTPADTTLTLSPPTAGRFLELTMIGNGANLLELFVYPSAQTSPPPTSADGYDLSSIGASSTVNDNFFAPGVVWPQSWPAGAFYPKSVANGGTESDAVATVDLGAQYDVSHLSLGFFWSTPWVNGGRIEVAAAATPDAFSTVYDSGRGQVFPDLPWQLPEYSFPAQPVRYIRATDYFTPGTGASAGTLWSLQAFQTPPPHVGYYPLSADGKYFAVNLARRPTGDPIQPTASVVYVDGVPPSWSPQSVVAGNAIDGDDDSLVLWTGAADPNASATLTLNLGQVQSIGAIRQIYGYPPVSSSIRTAETLNGPWTQVVPLGTPGAAGETTSSFATASAQYVELTMTGTPAVGFANLAELQVFPSSTSDPAPSSGSHLELGYLTGITASANANMGVAGGYQIHSASPNTYYVKTAAQGATGDATVTLDLGQQYKVSELTLGWLYNETWPAGGKVEVDDGSGSWPTVFDSLRGTPLGLAEDGPQRISFAARTARYVRLTGYFDPNAAASGLLLTIEVFGSDNVCVKQCSGKVCGGNLDDGCGGVCPSACTTGQIGCAANADCAPGSICTNRSPDPAAPRLCVPILCGSTCSATCPCSGGATCLTPSECATNFSCEQSVCACQTSCAGKACGAPDGCGGVCADGCGPGDACQPRGCLAGLTCSASGVCAAPPSSAATTGKTRPYATLPSDADAILPSSENGAEAPGRLSGASTVDSSGVYHYRMPLEVPPGRAGMQPDLALNYSSTAGNGLLGVGWSLDGLSAIARCKKTVAREGIADSIKVKRAFSCIPGQVCPSQFPQYTPDIDNFCLDGEKLVRVGGNDTSPEFRTERDIQARIVATYDGANWPSYFTVWRKDGNIATYQAPPPTSAPDGYDVDTGAPSATRFSGILSWPIATLQDRFGNQISYDYFSSYENDEPTAARLPNSITYTTCATGSVCPYGGASRYVHFSYESRVDYLPQWAGGLTAGVGLRLSSIEEFTLDQGNQKPVRSYSLGYDSSLATGRSRVTSVTLCDAAGACVPSTTFNWGSQSDSAFRRKWHILGPAEAFAVDLAGECNSSMAPGCFREDYTIIPDVTGFGLAGESPVRTHMVIGDFDGNGSDDIFALQLDGGFALYLSSVVGGQVTFSKGLPADVGLPDLEAHVLDVDQDGIAELIERDGSTSNFNVLHYNLSNRDFEGVSLNARDALKFTTVYRNHPNPPFFMDVNGDGVLDELWDSKPAGDAGDESSEWMLSTALRDPDFLLPNGYAPPQRLFWTPAADEDALFHAGRCRLDPMDYAGHGRKSPVGVCDDTTFAALGERADPGDAHTWFIDLNGDGLSDTLRFFNKGSVSSVTERISTGIELEGGNGTQPIQANMQRAQQTAPVDIDDTKGFASGGQATWENLVADLNGDGLTDIVRAGIPNTPGGPEIWLSRNVSGRTVLDKVVLPYTRQRFAAPQLGDFNGDGLPDIVQELAHGKLQFLIQDPSNRDDVITGVRSDSVSLADITYKAGTRAELGPLPSVPTNRPCCDHTGLPDDGPVFVPRRGLNVVSHLEAIEGKSHGSYYYQYSDPAADTSGRGFLGFGTVIKADVLRSSLTTTTYENTRFQGALDGYHIFPFASIPHTIQTTTGIDPLAAMNVSSPLGAQSSYLIKRTDSRTLSHQTHVLNSPDGALSSTSTFFVEENAIVDKKYDENGTLYYPASVTRTYDDFGNVTVSDSFDGPEFTHFHAVFSNDTSASWLVGKLENSDTTRSRLDFTGPPASQTTAAQTANYSWGVRGELLSIKRRPGDYRTQTFTEFDLDDAGLTKSTTVSDAFGNERAESVEYSSDGVYAEHLGDALGHDTWIGYHPGLGVPLISYDPNGNRTLYKYDGFGTARVVLPTRAPATTLTYAPLNGTLNVTTTQSPGTSKRILYDQVGNILSSYVRTNGDDSETDYSYDLLGRVQSKTVPYFGPDASPGATTYLYDNLNNVGLQTNPDGSRVGMVVLDAFSSQIVSIGDNSAGNPSRITVVHRTQDGLIDSVRENSTTGPASTRGVDYVYGQGKGLVQVTELGGPTTTYYSYGLPKPMYVTDAEHGETALLYDGFLNVQSVAHAAPYPQSSDSTAYQYDSLGRLAHISATSADPANPNGSATRDTSYGYDVGSGAIGQLSSASSPDGIATAYSYTPEGLLAEKKYTSGSDVFRTDYQYDSYGRIGHVDYPETAQARFGVDFAYNDTGATADGSLRLVSRAGTTYWHPTLRWPDGAVASAQIAGGLTQSLGENSNGQLTDIGVDASSGSVYGVHYDYFKGGNVETKTDEVTGVVDQYQYDSFDQLVNWTSSGGGLSPVAESYGYDGLANQKTSGGTTRVFGGTGFSPHQLASQTSSTEARAFGYDYLGRQKSMSVNGSTARTVTYTPFDLPSTITTAQTVKYLYDADQHKFRESDDTSTTTYVGDLYERRVDAATGITKNVFTVFAEGQRVAQIVQEGATETTNALHSDILGSVTGETRVTGGLSTTHQAFSPWGDRIVSSSASLQTQIADVTTGFTGQEQDDGVGLINMRGRVYDPFTRTFLTPDPIVGSPFSASGWSKYAYVRNNPLLRVDPSGFEDMTVFNAAGGIDRTEQIDMTIVGYGPNPYYASMGMNSSVAGNVNSGFDPGFSPAAGAANPASVSQGAGGAGADPTQSARDYVQMLNDTAYLREGNDGTGPKYIEMPNRSRAAANDGNEGRSSLGAPPPALTYVGTVDPRYLPTAEPPPIVVAGEAVLEEVAAEVEAEAAGKVLADEALVCRGGLCTADRFANGSGVTLDSAGRLEGASVNAGGTLEEITSTIRNGQVGVTTVGEVRALGGQVTPSPRLNNPFHCTLCSITPQQAEQLFTPVVPNPSL